MYIQKVHPVFGSVCHSATLDNDLSVEGPWLSPVISLNWIEGQHRPTGVAELWTKQRQAKLN